MCRGSETSKDLVWAWSEGKVLSGAGKCSSEEERVQRNWKGVLGLCYQGMRCLDSILWVRGARSGPGAGLCHLSMTGDLWESSPQNFFCVFYIFS